MGNDARALVLAIDASVEKPVVGGRIKRRVFFSVPMNLGWFCPQISLDCVRSKMSGSSGAGRLNGCVGSRGWKKGRIEAARLYLGCPRLAFLGS